MEDMTRRSNKYLIENSERQNRIREREFSKRIAEKFSQLMQNYS